MKHRIDLEEFFKIIFEELDEMVYVSDFDTYEIVYMNKHLRNSLGYRSKSEYANKKCYEILQGIGAPCRFCTNPKLKEREFISWVHKNPILNKRYMIKDTKFVVDHKAYRLEIAIDMDSETTSKISYFYARNESVLIECLQQVFTTTNAEDSLMKILEYIGKTFICDRVYIFEFDNKVVKNTYEWCGSKVVPQKEVLQNVAASDINWWISRFKEKEVIIIEQLEEIRLKHPITYAILKPQSIDRLVAGAIMSSNKLTGFIGVDNPNSEMMDMIASLLKVIGYFIDSLLRRRDLLKKMNALSFQDTLTKAYNRNALFEKYGEVQYCQSMAVVYCDVTGLKQTNDTLGHNAGDQLLKHCYSVIQNSLKDDIIFRTGGDEFVIVYENIEKQEFMKKVENLQNNIKEDKYHIAVGFVWSDQPPFNLDDLIGRADKIMYQDKKKYYETTLKVKRNDYQSAAQAEAKNSESLFYRLIKTTYCDMEWFFKAISQQNSTSYFFFGDMQKEMFFISDNMREEFGFESNIVPGLLRDWSKRIVTKKSYEMYKHEMELLIHEKRNVYDLRYQVRNKKGKIIWIRCYGVLKWDENKTIPLFFAGRMSHQDEYFVVDSITNFPKEAVMFRYLDELRENNRPTRIIGFSLNMVTEINRTIGRVFCDNVIRSASEELVDRLSDKMAFFRIEGVRCIAIVDSDCKDDVSLLIKEMKAIISKRFETAGINTENLCSFAVMKYPQKNLMPADLLEQMLELLKIAKQETKLDYVEYSNTSIEKSKQILNMEFKMDYDVFHEMNNFNIVIQPIVSTATGEITGGEALVRWNYQGNEILPEVFLPIMKKRNTINLAGRWIFEQVVITLVRINAYDSDFFLTWNMSPEQIADESFPEYMKEVLKKYNTKGENLVVEITESCLEMYSEQSEKFINFCIENGIKIALDDFGSGYSSFKMLLQYPLNIIKLDCVYLKKWVDQKDKLNLISSIVYTCHKFGKSVCTEGVEEEILDKVVKEAGCDMAQGYYYYEPMSIEEIYELLFTQKL